MKNRKKLISLGLLALLLTGCNYGGIRSVSQAKFNKFYSALEGEKNRQIKLGDDLQAIVSASVDDYVSNEQLELKTNGYENWEILANGNELAEGVSLQGLSFKQTAKETAGNQLLRDIDSTGTLSNAVAKEVFIDEDDPDASYSTKKDTTSLLLNDSSMDGGSELISMSIEELISYADTTYSTVDFVLKSFSKSYSSEQTYYDGDYKVNEVVSTRFAYEQKNNNAPSVVYSYSLVETRTKEGSDKTVTVKTQNYLHPDTDPSVCIEKIDVTTYTWIAAEGRWDEGQAAPTIENPFDYDYDSAMKQITVANLYQTFKTSNGLVRLLNDFTNLYQGYYQSFAANYKDQENPEIFYQYGVYQHRAHVNNNVYIQHTFFAASKSPIKAPILSEISQIQKVDGGLKILTRATFVYNYLTEL